MSSETQQPRWILSFADLLSVVLSFLVLAYSMSLPTSTKGRYLSKEGTGAFSVKGSSHSEDIAIAKNDQGLSTNYLYQVTEKKIAANTSLAGKITLKSVGDSLVMTLKAEDFTYAAPQLSQLLKVVKNDVWLYASNLDTSRNAYNELKKHGFNRNITIMEADVGKTQIDIVVHP